MDRLSAMSVFARVARLGGFAVAARELRLSTTAVSRHVAQLEEHLRVRLLQRTTRRVSVTEAGAAYLVRCERLLADLEELEDAVGDGRREPRGRLRVSAGVSFAQEQLHATMPRFLTRYPAVEVELVLSDRHVDLVGEGIDVALRVGRLPDSSLFARRIAPCSHVVCAAESYLEARGTPRTVDDLAAHDCIIDTNLPRGWRFVRDGQPAPIREDGRYRVNSAHGACSAAVAGLGLAYLPAFVAGPSLHRGALVALPHLRAVDLHLYAVYPQARYLSSGVRAFIISWSMLLPTSLGTRPPAEAISAPGGCSRECRGSSLPLRRVQTQRRVRARDRRGTTHRISIACHSSCARSSEPLIV